MALAVVRCPACRGAARVESAARGATVGCPRCRTPFLAVEELPARADRSRAPRERAAPDRAAARPAAVIPIAPPRLPRPASDPAPVAEAAPGSRDPEHDPHHATITGLPLSMLVGMALIPFGIPLLWFVAPFVTGQDAALSLAVPVSLAVAASALCLGVVYTIDWTGTTRVKGVLMLVGLSYLSAAGLYFLKKDLVEQVQRLGGDPNQWNEVALDRGKCRVRMPGRASEYRGQPLDGLAHMTAGREARSAGDAQYVYRIAVGKPTLAAGKADDEWFARVREKLKAGGGALVQEEGIQCPDLPNLPGRQWTFKLDDQDARVVQVFAARDRVYYLSAEGPLLTAADADHGRPFFGKFRVNKEQ
jgi:hypothetical protein